MEKQQTKKQFNVRDIPQEVLKDAKIKAIRENKSLSEVVRELLEKWTKNPSSTK